MQNFRLTKLKKKQEKIENFLAFTSNTDLNIENLFNEINKEKDKLQNEIFNSIYNNPLSKFLLDSFQFLVVDNTRSTQNENFKNIVNVLN